MLKAVGIFNRNKNSRPFKDFYAHWFNNLKNNLLPLLRRSLSHPDSPTVLSSHVELVHQHFQSLYHALDDLAASNDVALLLFPDWRHPLEHPLLWLGDLHPYIFTNLVRSLLQDDDADAYFTRESMATDFPDRPWQVAMAWSNPSETLTKRMDQIERGLRAMVPTLTTRLRNSEAVLVDRVVAKWYPCRERRAEAKVAVGTTLAGHVEELGSIFLDANRLRRSVLWEIVSETSACQAALFLEALAQLLIEMRDNHDRVAAVGCCRDARPGHH